MYGGHITDDRDRRFCGTFLDNLMNEGLLEEPELFPFIEGGKEMFRCPAPTVYDKYSEHILEAPTETPMAYGMHPNAEIDFLTKTCNSLFATLQEIQPRGASGGEGGNPLVERVTEFMVRVSDEAALESNRLNVEDISGRIGEQDNRTPFQNSFLQECQYMNAVIDVIVTDLSDIKLAFKGELTMTA
jgi:dynein heavy chain